MKFVPYNFVTHNGRPAVVVDALMGFNVWDLWDTRMTNLDDSLYMLICKDAQTGKCFWINGISPNSELYYLVAKLQSCKFIDPIRIQQYWDRGSYSYFIQYGNFDVTMHIQTNYDCSYDLEMINGILTEVSFPEED